MDKIIAIGPQGGAWKVFNNEAELHTWARSVGPRGIDGWTFRRIGPKLNMTEILG